MKWLVIAGFLVCLARVGSGSALCLRGSASPACLEKEIQVTDDPIQQIKSDKNAELLEAECLAGSEWESNCHSCQCSSDGVAQCIKMSTCASELTDLEPIRCKPNTSFKRDCNSCICLDNGLGLCTLKFCRRNTSPTNMVTGKECAAGSHWKSQCNNCQCSSEGIVLCTDKACPGKETEPEVRCAPDSVWKSDCNTCWCEGGHTACTRMACVSFPVTMHFDDEIPEATSTENEKTEIVLKSGQSKNKTIVCVANRMFIKDCNTCWCNEDGTGFFCTRRVCIPELPDEPLDDGKPEELRIIRKECRPDEVFELDCNMCRCNPDGQSFSCTRRACFTEPSDPVIEGVEIGAKNATLTRKVRALPAQEPPKACQPGQEFRMDCNKCLCDNQGSDFSCTRIDCRAINNNNNGGTRKKREVAQQAITQCEPGSVFEQSCNVCRCTSDGHHATCTLKRCSLEPQVQKDNDDSDLLESDPNFRCNPGEQFKRRCNDCTCSADGKSVFCTLRLCDKDLSPRL